jgi:RNA polymerase sigma factor (TIGR02999 family)
MRAMTGSHPRTRRLLARAAQHDASAAAELTPLIYDDLRALAASYLRRERTGHTLQPTALVHEAFVQLARDGDVDARERATFVAFAAQAMRRVLVEHARKRAAQKRGADNRRVTLSTDLAAERGEPVDVLALEEALEELARLDARQATIVELRFYGGLSVEEVAASLDLSKRSVEADWTLARAWLRRRLTPRV